MRSTEASTEAGFDMDSDTDTKKINNARNAENIRVEKRLSCRTG